MSNNSLHRRGVRTLNSIDTFFYIAVGLTFVVAAVLTLGYSLFHLATGLYAIYQGTSNPNQGFAPLILTFVNDLLLVLIILEVLGTIRSYLGSHRYSVQPFIFIGIISATRGILAIGARLSLATSGTVPALTDTEFRNSIVELGVYALIIILLGITLRVMGRFATSDDVLSEE